MPIPELDARGLLPPGIHQCSMEELRERFGVFQQSDKRVRLFERLESYVRAARSTRAVRAIVVDGSFVTGKPCPSDIDLVVVLPMDLQSDMLNPSVYNAISKNRIRKNYPFDAFVAAEGGLEYNKYVDFFRQVKDQPGLEKGLLRVEL